MPGLRSILFATALALVAALSAVAAETNTQKSAANGVTVTVTPNLRAARAWEFKVVLDTHTQDLSDDLTKTAVLIDAAGNRQAPTAWDGAAPGGHHREGVLRFSVVAPLPAFIELQIARFGEPAPRSFRWQLQ